MLFSLTERLVGSGIEKLRRLGSERGGLELDEPGLVFGRFVHERRVVDDSLIDLQRRRRGRKEMDLSRP